MAYSDIYKYEPGRADGEPETEPTTLSLQPTLASDPEPVNDRMGVHVCVEIGLLLLFATSLFLLYRDESAPLATAQIRNSIAIFIVPLLLCAIAVAASMRVRAANVAVGATALASGVIFSELSSYGLIAAAAGAIGAGIGIGIVLAAVVIILRMPSWLASLGAAVAIVAWIRERIDMESVDSGELAQLTPGNAWMWLVGIAIVSIVFGIVGATGRVRNRLGICANVLNDSHVRATMSTKLLVGLMLISSCALAAAAGVWLVWSRLPNGPVHDVGLDPLVLTLFGFAAVLLGGTSVHGRRGGVLGTLLACLVLGAVMTMHALHAWSVSTVWILLGAAALGLIVMRIVDAAGSPKRSLDADTGPDSTFAEDRSQTSAFDRGDIDPYRGAAR